MVCSVASHSLQHGSRLALRYSAVCMFAAGRCSDKAFLAPVDSAQSFPAAEHGRAVHSSDTSFTF